MYREVETTDVGCDIRVSDILWIHTRHSLYEFFVIDPVRVYGVVKGGVLGASATEALVCHPMSLAPGKKAQLMIESPTGIRYITTSPITCVKHFRSE
jgi:hypothetical protein